MCVFEYSVSVQLLESMVYDCLDYIITELLGYSSLLHIIPHLVSITGLAISAIFESIIYLLCIMQFSWLSRTMLVALFSRKS